MLLTLSVGSSALGAGPEHLYDATAGGATADGVLDAAGYACTAGVGCTPSEYEMRRLFTTGVGSSAYGKLGAGAKLYVDSSTGGALTFALERSGDGCVVGSEAIVIYFDIGGAGLPSTESFSDNTTAARAAAAGFGTASGRAVLDFPPGFVAKYALVIVGGQATLLSLESASFTDVGAPSLASNGCVMEVGGLTMADLGLAAGGTFKYLATLIEPASADRSNEFQGAATTAAGQIGAARFKMGNGDFNTFATVLPSRELQIRGAGTQSWFIDAYRGTGFGNPSNGLLAAGLLNAGNWKTSDLAANLDFGTARTSGNFAKGYSESQGAPTSGSLGLVISQVYGGGGNSGAVFRNDYIEIFNRGLKAVPLADKSVQYASSSGTSWQTVALTGTLQPGQYYLVQMASGGAVGATLPTAQSTSTINMSATDGKVALVNSTVALSGCAAACSQQPTVLDFVGFGGANDKEGANAPGGSNSAAIVRKDAGCTDSQNNNGDFSTLSLTTSTPPRNTSSATAECHTGLWAMKAPIAGATRYGLALRPGINDFTGTAIPSDALYLRVKNTTGSTIVGMHVTYDVLVCNDNARATTFNLAYSATTDDAASYASVTGASYTTPAAADTTPAWTVAKTVDVDLSAAGWTNIGPDGFLYLRWDIADVASQTGGRDAIALERVSFTPTLAADMIVDGFQFVPAEVDAGDEATLEVILQNNGPGLATDIDALITVPSEVIVTEAELPSDCAYDAGTVLCNVASLVATGEVYFYIPVTAALGASGSAHATIEISSASLDPDPQYDTAAHDLLIGAATGADLELTATLNPTGVYVGESSTLTVIVNNHGPAEANNVMLNVGTPTNGFIAEPFPQGCTGGPTAVDCSLGLLPVTGQPSFEFTITSVASADSLAAVSVSVTSTTSDPGNFPNSAGPMFGVGYCGDGVVQSAHETCDDSSNAGPGCDETCHTESGYICPPAGGVCEPDLGGAQVSLTPAPVFEPAETHDGLGTSLVVSLSNGGTVTATGVLVSVTAPLNALIDTLAMPGECLGDLDDVVCDVGSVPPGLRELRIPMLASADPGSTQHTAEIQLTHDGSQSMETKNAPLTVYRCGDGVTQPTWESCDDGNADGTDGCKADCSAVEPGWSCPPEGGACTRLLANLKFVSDPVLSPATVYRGDATDLVVHVVNDADGVADAAELTITNPVNMDVDVAVLTARHPECIADATTVYCYWATLAPHATVDLAIPYHGKTEPAPRESAAIHTLDTTSIETNEADNGFTLQVVVGRCQDYVHDDGREACDDGTPDGDGCSSTCAIEPGWECHDGSASISICTRYPADLEISAAAFTSSSIYGEGPAKLTFSGKNNATFAVTNVVVRTEIANGISFIGGAGCVSEVTHVRCDAGTVAAGGVFSFDVDFTVQPSAPASITLTPTVLSLTEGQFDDMGGNNSKDAVLSVGRCGDGALQDPPEGCDDGDTEASDGCSASCAVEDGWTCPTAGQPCVPNATHADLTFEPAPEFMPALIYYGETTSLNIWVFNRGPDTAKGVLLSVDNPSNALINDQALPQGCVGDVSSILCDLGDVPTGGVQRLIPFVAIAQQSGLEFSATVEVTSDNEGAAGDEWAAPKLGVAKCGDTLGQPVFDEVCDDGNSVSGDGCSSDCKTVEEGWTCPPSGGPCSRLNANLLLSPPPTFMPSGVYVGQATTLEFSISNDGSTTAHDLELSVTPPANATLDPSFLPGHPECDGDDTFILCLPPSSLAAGGYLPYAIPFHGKFAPGVPSSDATITVETSTPESTTADNTMTAALAVGSCGDGVYQAVEGCDDGNAGIDDGCTPECAIEPGWECGSIPGGPSLCSLMAADLEVFEAHFEPATPVYAGGGATLMVSVRNNETFDVHNVVVRTTYNPAELVPEGGQSDCVLETAGTLRCDLGTMIGGGRQLEIRFFVAQVATVSSATAHTVISTTERADDNPGNEEKDATVQIRRCGDSIVESASAMESCDDGNHASGDGCSETCQTEPGYHCDTPGEPCTADLADVSIDADAAFSPSIINEGDGTTLILTVRNSGPNPATNVQVTIGAPSNAEIGVLPNGCVGPAPTISCGIGALGVGESLPLSIPFVGSSVQAEATAAATLQVTSDTVDGSPANNSLTRDLTVRDVRDADVAIRSVGFATSPIYLGFESSMLTVEVANLGDKTATDVHFTLSYPTPLTFTGPVPGGCTAEASGFLCSFAELAPTVAPTLPLTLQFNFLSASTTETSAVVNVAVTAAVNTDTSNDQGSVTIGLEYCGDGTYQQRAENCDDGAHEPGDGCGPNCSTETGWTCPGSAPCYPSPTDLQASASAQPVYFGQTTTLSLSLLNVGQGANANTVIDAKLRFPEPTEYVTLDLDGTDCVRDGTDIVCSRPRPLPPHPAADYFENFNIPVTFATSPAPGGATSVAFRVTADSLGPDPDDDPNPGNDFSDVSLVLQYCGDGSNQGTPVEQCDDGDLAPGDGCTAACTVEPGYTCPSQGGDCSRNEANVVFDAGPGFTQNPIYDGAATSLVMQVKNLGPGYEAVDVAIQIASPANALARVDTLPEGCSGTPALITCAYASIAQGSPRAIQIDYVGDAGANLVADAVISMTSTTIDSDGLGATLPLTVGSCGDGVRQSEREECDDGDVSGGDGCDADCLEEDGWTCDEDPGTGVSVCVAECGDGQIDPGETCDDGTRAGGDGCADCAVEAGWQCDPMGGGCCNMTTCPAATGCNVATCDYDSGSCTLGPAPDRYEVVGTELLPMIGSRDSIVLIDGAARAGYYQLGNAIFPFGDAPAAVPDLSAWVAVRSFDARVSTPGGPATFFVAGEAEPGTFAIRRFEGGTQVAALSNYDLDIAQSIGHVARIDIGGDGYLYAIGNTRKLAVFDIAQPNQLAFKQAADYFFFDPGLAAYDISAGSDSCVVMASLTGLHVSRRCFDWTAGGAVGTTDHWEVRDVLRVEVDADNNIHTMTYHAIHRMYSPTLIKLGEIWTDNEATRFDIAVAGPLLVSAGNDDLLFLATAPLSCGGDGLCGASGSCHDGACDAQGSVPDGTTCGTDVACKTGACVPLQDLGLTMTTATPGIYGTAIGKMRVTLTNPTSVAATNVRFTHERVSGLDYGALPAGCTASTAVLVDCTVPSIAALASAELEWDVSFPLGSSLAAVSYHAAIDGFDGYDPNAANNEATGSLGHRYCGDTTVDSGDGETCDDGNAAPGEGCSATCTIEPGWECPTPGSPCEETKANIALAPLPEFMPAEVYAGQQPMLHVHVANGGPAQALNVIVHVTPPANAAFDPDSFAWPAQCSGENGELVCPVGDIDPMGSAEVVIPFIAQPVTAPTDQYAAVSLTSETLDPFPDGNSATARLNVATCGDAVTQLTFLETCDDGQRIGGDGCDASCHVEPGWTCPGDGIPCTRSPADLELSGVSLSPTAAYVGEDVALSFQVQNLASFAVGGVSATVQLGTALTFVATGSTAGCVLDGTAVRCALGTLGSLASATPTVVLRASAGPGQPFGVEVAVSSSERGDDNTGNNAGSPSLSVRYCGDGGFDAAHEACDDGDVDPGDGCDASCHVEDGWACPTPGQPCERTEFSGDLTLDPPPSFAPAADVYAGTPVTLNIDVTNAGPDGVGNVVVTVVRPANAAFGTLPGPCTGGPETITCSYASINAGQVVHLAVPMVASQVATPGDELASVSVSSTNSDPDTTNNQASVRLNVAACGDGVRQTTFFEGCDDGDRAPGDGCDASCHTEEGWTCPEAGGACTRLDSDLAVTVEAESSVYAGANAAVTVTAQNLASHPVTGVVVNVSLPTGLEWVSGDCAVDGAGLRCAVGTLVAGESRPYANVLSVAADVHTSPLTVGATIASTVWPDAQVGNDHADDSIEVRYCGDGVREGVEACDDGNLVDGDGCSACSVDSGWQCDPVGNGKCCDMRVCNAPGECRSAACDYGTGQCRYTSTNESGSCTGGDTCKTGWSCESGACVAHGDAADGTQCETDGNCFGGVCIHASCANGVVEMPESCDDGGHEPGDGCDETCVVEDGWLCTNVPGGGSTCVCDAAAGYVSDGIGNCVVGYDFGDAPASYDEPEPARHSRNFFFLGTASPDLEAGPQSGPLASGDGSDPTGDDGVVIATTLGRSDAFQSAIRITVGKSTVLGLDSCVIAWVDQNADGHFDTEQEFVLAAPAGKLETYPRTIDAAISLDSAATLGTSYLRVRVAVGPCFDDDSNFILKATGSAAPGEVEDYAVTIVDSCGDGNRGPAEGCDDGDTQGADGCSTDCQVEEGWVCTEDAQGHSTCARTCGDGDIDPGETCDDGDREGGDGCDATCTPEAGWDCPPAGGNCTLSAADLAMVETGFVETSIYVGGEATLHLLARNQASFAVGGVAVRVDLDDVASFVALGSSPDCAPDGSDVRCTVTGPLAPNGTAAFDVRVKVAASAAQANTSATATVSSSERADSNTGNDSLTALLPLRYCGDGQREQGLEACDDGDAIAGDGCSACHVDDGWQCAPDGGGCCDMRLCDAPGECRTATCDFGSGQCGYVSANEANTCTGNDPCKVGYQCTQGTCAPTGNAPDGDICETDGYCEGGSCKHAACGNGVREPGEGCDDGDHDAGDGCSAGCTVESPAWSCTGAVGALSVCGCNTAANYRDPIASDGVVECRQLDFGDAAASYKTLFADDGPRHAVDLRDGYKLTIGSAVTAELDGTPSAHANSDGSDDGASFSGLRPSVTEVGFFDHTFSFSGATNTNYRACWDAWIDFDQDGVFGNNLNEVVVSTSGGGTNSHPQTFSVQVPAGAKVGKTMARVRVHAVPTPATSCTPLPAYGYGGVGEVEDLEVTVSCYAADGWVDDGEGICRRFEFGDAGKMTDPLGTDSYGTKLPNGARHVFDPGGPRLGDSLTYETDGKPSALANLDSEDNGVATLPTFPRGKATVSFAVTTEASFSTHYTIKTWVDFDRDGEFESDELFAAVDASGTHTDANPITVSGPVPAGASLGATAMRVRVARNMSGIGPTGRAADGEVEDYRVAIVESVDLDVSLAADPATVYQGGATNLVVDVQNASPTATSDVTFDLSKPTGLVFGSIEAVGCHDLGTVIRCDLGAIQGASGSTLLVPVTIAADRADDITVSVVALNQAFADPDDSDNASATITVLDCGDGVVNGDEACDDDDRDDGDGCSASCHVEDGWSCSGTAPTICTRGTELAIQVTFGPSTVYGTEGATMSVLVDNLSPLEATNVVFSIPRSDDLVYGALHSDCTALSTATHIVCKLASIPAHQGLSRGWGVAFAAGSTVPSATQTATITGQDGIDLTASNDSASATLLHTFCGDGTTQAPEACDDPNGNADAPDRCRTDCTLPRCGDGIVDTTEGCDDGAGSPVVGCTACVVDAGYDCGGAPSTCALREVDLEVTALAFTPSGIYAGGEVALDTTVTNHGAQAATDITATFSLSSGAPLSVGETGPGCSVDLGTGVATCHLDALAAGASQPLRIARFVTATAPTVVSVTVTATALGSPEHDTNEANDVGDQATLTIRTCGDGALSDGETCDDGNNDDGDGCRGAHGPGDSCTTEAGYTCEGTGAASCTPNVDLEVVSAAFAADDVYAGGTVHFLASLANHGPKTANDAVAVFTLAPAGALTVADGGGCTVVGATFTCPLGVIAANGTASIDITFQAPSVPADASATVTATSFTSAGFDVDHINDAGDSDTVAIGRCGDGAVNGAEGCDDGDQDAGDGCAATCQVEGPAWTCTNTPANTPDSTCGCSTAGGYLDDGTGTCLRYDFGDAGSPDDGSDSYGTLLPGGARHVYGSAIHFGTKLDYDVAPQTSAGADYDDGVRPNEIDDEDALASAPTFARPTAAYAFDVSAKAPSGTGYDIKAWVDFDRDGTFDGDELFASVHATGTGAVQTITLSGAVPADAALGQTAMRLRVGSDLTAVGPTGRAPDGEVEDHAVTIAEGVTDVDVALSSTLSPVYAGGATNVVVTVDNKGPADTSAVQVDLDKPAGLTFGSLVGTGCVDQGTSLRCTIAALAKNTTAPAITLPATVAAGRTSDITVSLVGLDHALVDADATDSASTTIQVRFCGDGVTTAGSGESCDDGDAEAGDGCSAACQPETDWVCSGAPTVPSTCTRRVDLATTAFAFAEASVYTGGTATLNVTVANHSAHAAPSATLVIGAPTAGGLVYKSASGATCTTSAGAATCDFAVAAGGAKTFTLTYDIASPATVSSASVAVTSLASGEVDPDASNNGGSATIAVRYCGDGLVTGSETCDDGNGGGGDGCSAACAQESGWVCAGAGACTKRVDLATTAFAFADDAIYTGGSTTLNVTVANQSVHAVPSATLVIGAPTTGGLKFKAATNGGGTTCGAVGNVVTCTLALAAGESKSLAVDYDIATPATVGSATVAVSSFTSGEIDPDTSNNGGSDAIDVRRCGDNVISAGFGEACDDGNANANDGCSATCTVETDWSCSGTGAGSCTRRVDLETTALAFAADSVYARGTVALDVTIANHSAHALATATAVFGAPAAGSIAYLSASGATCSSNAGVVTCTFALAANGTRSFSLTYQAAAAPTVGAASVTLTSVSSGFTDPVGNEVKSDTVDVFRCGDASKQVDAGETCDDGNTTPGDGCDETCEVESGWVCTGAGAGSCKREVDLATTALAFDKDSIYRGETTTLAVTVANNSTVAVSTATVVLSVPAGLAYLSASSGVTCTAAAGQSSCKLALPASSSKSFTLTFGTTTDNVASATVAVTSLSSGSADPNPGNNTKSDSIQLFRCGDGSIQAASGESCDDSNDAAGDGCSDTCALEPDWVCEAGACEKRVDLQVSSIAFAENDIYQDGTAHLAVAVANASAHAVTGAKLRLSAPSAGALIRGAFTMSGGTCVQPAGGSSQFGKIECTFSIAAGATVTINGLYGATPNPSVAVGTVSVESLTSPSVDPDPANNGGSDSVTVRFCGDGKTDFANGETCDDGNDVNSDACPDNTATALAGHPVCRVATCGDGYRNAATEGCDDGNTSNADDCPSGLGNGTHALCQPATCGDGYVRTATTIGGLIEVCDDGNASNSDACPSGVPNAAHPVCRPATCGDGYVFSSGGDELCDDGNGVDGDACPDGATGECRPVETCGTVDTDGDGDPDCSDPDDDGDGASDEDEMACGSDPLVAASVPADVDEDGECDALDGDDDDDGWDDGDELACETDPRDAASNPTALGTDMDGDRLCDPRDPDDDGDGRSDAEEDLCGSDAHDPASLPLDTDGDEACDAVDTDDDDDGVGDDDEVAIGSDPKVVDSDGDGLDDGVENADHDGVVDERETSPTAKDSDDDGIEDGVEAGSGYPTRAGGNEPTLGYRADTDGDGLSDGQEDADHDGELDAGETNPLIADTDGDGADDGEEVLCGSDALDADDIPVDVDGNGTCDTRDEDSDGDGVADGVELFCGTDPDSGGSAPSALDLGDGDDDGLVDCVDADDDDDQVSDADELVCGTAPRDASSTPSAADVRDSDDDGTLDCADGDDDGDGIDDGDEAANGTDPLDADSDDDGLADGRELDLGTDPTEADTDGDGVQDGTEVGETEGTAGTDRGVFTADGDAQTTTDPTVADTDGDGVADGDEDLDRDGRVDEGETDPNDPDDQIAVDSDGDGLSDELELAIGTDPTKPDTDGDGVSDAFEVNLGIDPLATDSDGGGVDDSVEIDRGTNPSDPTDDIGRLTSGGQGCAGGGAGLVGLVGWVLVAFARRRR